MAKFFTDDFEANNLSLWGSELPSDFIEQVNQGLSDPTGSVNDQIKLFVRPHN